MLQPLAPLPTVSAPYLIDRRRMMGTLGLATLGLAATSVPVMAATPKVSVNTKKSSATQENSAETNSSSQTTGAHASDVSAEWLALVGRDNANEYFKYLSKLKMQRVTPLAVILAHSKAKSGVWNTLPPKTWWARMGYVLRVVDRIAMEMNVNEVEIISAYRNPAYNARCPGAKSNSWHQANVAVDVKFPCSASSVTKTARNLRDLGLFRGGVGGYWNFTHIDARGTNINW